MCVRIYSINKHSVGLNGWMKHSLRCLRYLGMNKKSALNRKYELFTFYFEGVTAADCGHKNIWIGTEMVQNTIYKHKLIKMVSPWGDFGIDG